MEPAATGLQTLTLTGLRFNANLGILAHEKNAPQPIQVDAELSLGAQPLQPHDDDAVDCSCAGAPRDGGACGDCSDDDANASW